MFCESFSFCVGTTGETWCRERKEKIKFILECRPGPVAGTTPSSVEPKSVGNLAVADPVHRVLSKNNEEALVFTRPPWRPALPVWQFDGLGGWHGPWVTWTLGVPLPAYLPFSGGREERKWVYFSQRLCGWYLWYFYSQWSPAADTHTDTDTDFCSTGLWPKHQSMCWSLTFLNCSSHNKHCKRESQQKMLCRSFKVHHYFSHEVFEEAVLIRKGVELSTFKHSHSQLRAVEKHASGQSGRFLL